MTQVDRRARESIRRWSLGLSVAIGAAGLLLLVFRQRFQSLFLLAATRFDEEGVVSNPDWLQRPIISLAGILLVYALLRLVFEPRRPPTLEAFMIMPDRSARFRRIVLASTFLIVPGLFAIFAYAVTHPAFWAAYYSEDRLFENLTALLLFLAGLCTLAASALVPASALPYRLFGALTGVLLGAAYILLGLEEISYGQRIFGWETPEAMREENLQAETNIHNYWTHDVQATVAWVVGIGIFGATVVSAILRRFWKSGWARFLPDQAFLPYTAVILVLTSHAGFHEPLEQVVSLFAMLYGFQMARAAKESRQSHMKGR